MTVFVSIAAYRDPDLNTTIADCIAKARWPDQLRFGVCWQHAPGEEQPPDLPNGQMRLISVPWQDSRGACWARAEIMKLYDGEDWFLQIDSHHRFTEEWDAVLMEQAEHSGASLPLLTAYGAPFTPGKPLGPGVPTAIKLVDLGSSHGPRLTNWLRPEWAERKAPVPARFLGAGLLFAPGRFVEDVPYDPEIYFEGEEITLSIRAFTHGYDLFHPSRHILWHQEPRRITPLHWDDHVDEQDVAITAAQRNAASAAKVNRFLIDQPVGPLACGTARSFAEYEAYAGLDFRRRVATPEALRGDDPVIPVPLETWQLRIGLDRKRLPDEAIDQPRFWYVGFHDEDGAEIHRQDADRNELVSMLGNDNGRIVIERQIRTAKRPDSWTVWPVDKSGFWTEKLSGPAKAKRLSQ